MPLKELREKHGGSKSRQTLNRAIRAECPGGNETLDGLELVKQMLDRHGWEDERGQPTELVVAYSRLLLIANCMEDSIRERYGIPGRERDDLRR